MGRVELTAKSVGNCKNIAEDVEGLGIIGFALFNFQMEMVPEPKTIIQEIRVGESNRTGTHIIIELFLEIDFSRDCREDEGQGGGEERKLHGWVLVRGSRLTM